ncbi:MAG: DNA repair protein RadA [Candidatus Blackburnbacteria bacterium RIFCSPHIGHO2_01_FULL_43_15b]|uniref:DNA repair protein RadA n=1 Tax=Candidatus Blackburnbacteria bacterium RIFCSPHIGHO2_01_FULL_43_15b TaxID=1797513 RepID=A0A1G1UZH8_9BACT|nr:MAG: DNA repair protein RadA [Candidatus Blackburnbacteria bacterium RIFCSPHIGHO2_01_FULL_43_15b]
MPKSTSQYVCQNCGFVTPKWVGKCPSCGTWNSMVETVISTRTKRTVRSAQGRKAELVQLTSIKKETHGQRTSTKITELDRVLGGGIVSGMVTLVAGEPGIGKSTLLLQLASNVEGNVVYVAGEESATQIANRAARLGIANPNIQILEETDVDQIIETVSSDVWRVMGALEKKNSHTSPITHHPSLLIIDSIQTLTTTDLTGIAGAVGQVRESAGRLTAWAKRNSVPMFIVGHVTKEGTIAGPRVLEHMVDTVIWFEGERREQLRIVRAMKNRFGPTDEVGIFSMEESGLKEVDNPSNLFLGPLSTQGSAGQSRPSGSVITAIMEGTRPMLVEIQALVAPTKLAFPRRTSSGIDQRRLELIIAVLGRRVGIPLWDYDIYVNVAGGLKIEEPGADLAVALAIASAFKDKPLRVGTFAVGEVGLLGEIREVAQTERRTKEAKRLGFSTPITAKDSSTLSQAVGKYLATG